MDYKQLEQANKEIRTTDIKGKEYAELMYKIMQEMGKEKFEETIKQDFEKTQQFIIRYKIEV